MKQAVLEEAVRLAKEGGYILVATADSSGQPHVAAAGKIEAGSGGRVAVTEWFCPGTMANLALNSRVSIVIWEANSDSGFQLLGVSEGVKDLAMLDGFVPRLDLKPGVPQIERKILVRVERVLDFRLAPHSDVEE